MKRLLIGLAAITLTVSSTAAIVSCAATPTKSSDEQKFISDFLNVAFQEAVDANKLTEESTEANIDKLIPKIQDAVIAKVNASKEELEEHGIILLGDWVAADHKASFESELDYQGATDDVKTAHQAQIDGLTHKEVETIAIYTSNIVVSRSLNESERETLWLDIYSAEIVEDGGHHFILNSGKPIHKTNKVAKA